MELVLLREGLAARLSEYDDLVVIATAGLEQAMATVRESKPTTVVFEAYLSGLGSLDFVRKLWRVWLNLPLIVLDRKAHSPFAARLVALGIRGVALL